MNRFTRDGSSPRRVRRCIALLAVTAMATLAACGGAGGSGSGSGDEPIKIALIPPSGGVFAIYGRDTIKAWEFAADEVNAAGGVDGRKVEITAVETDGTPAATVRAARRAVTQDGARFIGGIITSPEVAALQPQLPSMNALLLNSSAVDDPLTGEQCNANAFRFVQNTRMAIGGVASSLKDLPAKKWAIMAVDYSAGRTSAKAFTKAVEASGGEVVMTQFAPQPTADFGSFITKLQGSGADGLYVHENGVDAQAFVNQGTQFNLFDSFKSIVSFKVINEPLFETFGQKVDGFNADLGYAHQLDNPENAAFVKAWKDEFGSDPYHVEADNYLTAQALFKAVEDAGSVEPKDVAATMEKLSMDSIVGPIEMRGADHQLQRSSYFAGVKFADGQLGWDDITEIPASQTTPTADPACKL